MYKKHIKSILALVLCLILVSATYMSVVAAATPTEIVFHVSTTGSDNNSGTASAPFATLEQAMKVVSKTEHYGIPVTVYVHGGKYRLNGKSQLFGGAASGTEDAKVTFKAAGDGEVLFSGFRDIDVTKFEPISDPAMRVRFKEDVIPYIGALDLAAQGFDRESLDMLLGKSKENSTPDTLEYQVMRLNGKEQYIAQWPNYGEFATVGKVLNAGATSRTSKDPRAIFKYTDSNVSRWADPSTAIIRGYLSNVYLEQWNAISNIDPVNQTIQMKYYNASPGLKEGRTWRVLNIPEELDVPGEYFVDVNTMTLYYYPPYKIADTDKLEMAVTKEACIKITEAQHIVFDGFTFEGFRLSGDEDGLFDLNMSHNIEIRNCRFGYNGGGSAIIIKKGTNNLVEACQFYNTGALGVTFYNNGYETDYSDYPTLEPDNNIVRNNHFYNTGSENLQSAGFAVGHSITSNYASDANVGNVIRNNLMHHMYGGMIITSMMEYDISYNEIANGLRILADYGLIYIGAYKHAYGNRMTYNYLHDFSSAIDPSYAVNGIYLDDWNSANITENNFIVPNSKGSINAIFNVGAYQTIRNNISVNTRTGVLLSNRETLYGGSQTVINGQVNRFAALPANMVEKYGFLLNIKPKTLELGGLFATMGNVMTGNVTVNGKNSVKELPLSLAEKVENNYVNEAEDYSMFVDPENHDWRIKSEFAEANGFDKDIMTDKNFSMDQIGIQKDVWDIKNPLDPFRQIYPKNGEEGVSSKDVVLNWEPALFADEYDWVLARDPELTDVVAKGTSVFEYANVGDLSLGQSYYWKVTARNVTKQIGAEWESSSVPFVFTTTHREEVDKSFLKTSIDIAEKAFADVQDGTGNIGEFKQGTKALLDQLLLNARTVYLSHASTQKRVDACVAELDRAVNGISAYKHMGYITLDTTNSELWKPAKPNTTVTVADGVVTAIGGDTVAYMGKVENYNMVKFKVRTDLSAGWAGFTLRQENPAGNVYSGRQYLVVMKPDIFEFQKYKVGAPAKGVIETVPNNGIVPDNEWVEIEFGVADADGGIQIFFKVNGETIFDYYDVDVPIYEEGYFCFKPPAGIMEIAPADSVPEGYYEPPADIASRGKSFIYTQTSAEFSSNDKWTSNKDNNTGYNQKGVYIGNHSRASATYTLKGTREEKAMFYYWHEPMADGDPNATVTITFNHDGADFIDLVKTIDFSKGSAGWKPFGAFNFNDFGGNGEVKFVIQGSGEGKIPLPVIKKTAISSELADFAHLFFLKADNMVALKIGAPIAFVNGGEMEISGAAPQIINSKTYLPLRFLADAFGYSVEWDSNTSTATVMSKDKTITLRPGENSMTVNGARVALEAPSIVQEGRTLLPVRNITEALGKTVVWNNSTQMVLVGDRIDIAENDDATFASMNEQFGGNE